MPIASKEFLARIREIGKEFSGGGGGGVVSRMIIETGYHRYVDGHDFWSFWKPCNPENKEDCERIAAELNNRLREAGSSDSVSFGFKVTIKKDVLGRDAWAGNKQEFAPEWQDHYNLIEAALEEAGNIPVNEEFWGRAEFKADPYALSKGEDGKKKGKDGVKRFPSVSVPVQVYANETEARAAAGGGSSSSGPANNSHWSDKALASYADTSGPSEMVVKEILDHLENAKKSIPIHDSMPLPTPATPPKIKQYIADAYDVEVADLDQMIPF